MWLYYRELLEMNRPEIKRLEINQPEKTASFFFYLLAILGEEKNENTILQKTFSIQTFDL